MKKIPLLILLQILIPFGLIAQYSFGYRNFSIETLSENHSKKALRKTDLVSPSFKFVGSEDSHSIYFKNGKYGLLFNNSFLTEPIFDKIDFLSKGIFACTFTTSKDTSIVLVGGNPSIYVNIPKAINVREISGINHFIFFTSTGLGIFNLDKTIIVPPIYDEIELYCKGYYLAYNKEKWDVFNFEGEQTYTTNPPQENSFFKIRWIARAMQEECYEDTILLYRMNDFTFKLLSFKGEVIDSNFKFTNDTTKRFRVENRVQKVKLEFNNNKQEKAQEKPPFLKEYDQNWEWGYYKSNNIYIVKKNGKWGVVDENNKIIFSISFDEIESESFFLKLTKNHVSFLIDYYGRIYNII